MQGRIGRLVVFVAVAGAVMFAPRAISGRESAIPEHDARAAAHVLDRIAFGPTPGEIDRVVRTGLGAYIDRQLHPERIEDGALAARLAAFDTLDMSTRELAEKYFLPATALRRQAQLANRSVAPNPAPDSQP